MPKDIAKKQLTLLLIRLMEYAQIEEQQAQRLKQIVLDLTKQRDKL
ncbi:MAG: hypothetical protein AAGA18_14785 [Verrucomicrobiota bacterium]